MEDERKPKQALFRMILARTMLPSVILVLAFLAFFWIQLGVTVRHNADMRLRNQQERLDQGVSDLERTLMELDNDQRAILVSSEFSALAYMYDDLDWYSRYRFQEQLYEKLFSLRNRYGCVANAYLRIPAAGQVISSARTKDTLPEWLASYQWTGSGSLQRYAGRLIYAISCAGETGDDELATFFVCLDEESIYGQLRHVLTGEADRLILRWNGDRDAPIGENGRFSDASGEYTVLTADGSSFDVQGVYLSGNDYSDSFFSQTVHTMSIFVALVLLVETLSLVTWYRQIYRPLSRLLREAFGRAEAGDLKYRISIRKNSPFFSVYDSYNRMMAKMEEYVENNLKQQLLISRANLKQLQSQISPHFMYNSYYVLYRLIKKGDKESSLLLAEHLGQFYQYITRNADDEKRLGEEVEHARNYAAIQKFRFRDALDIRIDAPDERIARVYVPRLILQPLLENAFKYAYETADGGAMILWIHNAVNTARSFDIFVENSGSVSDETLSSIRGRLDSRDETVEATALVNIHRRLMIYFGETSGLRVSRSSLGGLLVCIHIDDTREDA